MGTALALFALGGWLTGLAIPGAGLAGRAGISAAITLALLVPAALMLRDGGGWTEMLVARTPTGQMARRLVGASLVVPLAVAWLIYLLHGLGLLAYPIGLFAAAVAGVVILAGVSLVLSLRLDRSDKARRETARLVAAILENTPAVIYVKDREGRFQLVNRRVCEILGKTRDQLIGRTSTGLFSEAQVAGFRAADVRAMDSTDPVALEQSVVQGGETRHYLSLKSPLRDDDGAVVGMINVATDITDGKRAEARVAIQLDRLKLLNEITRSVSSQGEMAAVFQLAVDAIEDQLPADFACICRHDHAGNALSAMFAGARSAALAEALGMGRELSIPVDQNGLQRCTSQSELVYEPDILGTDFPFTQLLARHGMRSLILSPLPVEGDTLGVLIVARRDPDAFLSVDCEFLKQLGEHIAVAAHQAKLRTNLHQAYEDQKRAQQAMVASERLTAIGQMASGIAHDINNAISPVSVYTQSLIERDLALPDEVKEYLGIVNGVVRDLAATVARMRDFYRPALADAEVTPVDLNALVLQVVEHTRARWHDMPLKRGIVIDASTELLATLPAIQGEASELREMMTNLVFNAVDAMPEGGSITIRTSNPPPGPVLPQQLLLEVADTGTGMSEETRRRCLDPFFTTKGERGTGLGLAMVYGAVQRHHGHLEIHSAPGAGTSFALRFPALASVAAPSNPILRRPGRALRLLLVDDDPTVLRSTKMVLGLDKHHVVTAGNGGDAIKAASAAARDATPFDAVITDLGMPHIDGNQVAAAVKACSPGTVVVLLTGWGRRMGDGDESPASIDFVVPKPFQLEEMRAVLALVDQRTARGPGGAAGPAGNGGDPPPATLARPPNDERNAPGRQGAALS